MWWFCLRWAVKWSPIFKLQFSFSFYSFCVFVIFPFFSSSIFFNIFLSFFQSFKILFLKIVTFFHGLLTLFNPDVTIPARTRSRSPVRRNRSRTSRKTRSKSLNPSSKKPGENTSNINDKDDKTSGCCVVKGEDMGGGGKYISMLY